MDFTDFPESKYHGLRKKPNTGIVFSGGGSRAYVAAIGYLSGLVKLDLIKNIRYIGGISGGSWAAAVSTYAQNRSLDDLHFLGDVVFPNDMTIQSLKSMESDCARSFVNRT